MLLLSGFYADAQLYGVKRVIVGQVGFDTFTIGTEGQCEPPPGWTVKRVGRAFYNEMIVTSPGGPRR